MSLSGQWPVATSRGNEAVSLPAVHFPVRWWKKQKRNKTKQKKQKLFRDEAEFQQRQHWSSCLEAGQRENFGSRLIAKVCIVSRSVCGEACVGMLLAFSNHGNETLR